MVTILPYSWYGGDIETFEDTTVCLLGRYRELIDEGGTSIVIKAYSFKSGNNIGGINLLNFPPSEWSMTKNFNWLKEAILNNHKFRLISDITLRDNRIGSDGNKTVFYREVEYLEKHGILLNPIKAS